MVTLISDFPLVCIAALTAAATPTDRAPVATPQVVVLEYKAQPAKNTPKKKPAKKKRRRTKKKTAKTLAPSDALVVKVQKFYEQTDDLDADFIQIYTRKALSRTSESRGKLKIKKPGMMRWDYSQPEPKHFIANGQSLWIYEPEEEQVIVDHNFKTSQLSTPITFLWGQGDLRDSFTAKVGTGAPAKHSMLVLTPKSDATFTKLVLIVEDASGKVVESVLHETVGNTNHFKFRDIKTNVGLAASSFDFTPPDDVDVIER